LIFEGAHLLLLCYKPTTIILAPLPLAVCDGNHNHS
jgi:hypothetical protein